MSNYFDHLLFIIQSFLPTSTKHADANNGSKKMKMAAGNGKVITAFFQKETAFLFTHRRNIAERGGCFQRRLFVCGHDNFRTIKRRMMKVGG